MDDILFPVEYANSIQKPIFFWKCNICGIKPSYNACIILKIAEGFVTHCKLRLILRPTCDIVNSYVCSCDPIMRKNHLPGSTWWYSLACCSRAHDLRLLFLVVNDSRMTTDKYANDLHCQMAVHQSTVSMLKYSQHTPTGITRTHVWQWIFQQPIVMEPNIDHS